MEAHIHTNSYIRHNIYVSGKKISLSIRRKGGSVGHRTGVGLGRENRNPFLYVLRNKKVLHELKNPEQQ